MQWSVTGLKGKWLHSLEKGLQICRENLPHLEHLHQYLVLLEAKKRSLYDNLGKRDEEGFPQSKHKLRNTIN
jgi:hypothetical protein